MSYKRIITSVAVIVAVGVAVAGATGAFYSDTETSENNIFTAGSIDLQVDHTLSYYNGLFCEDDVLVEQCELGNLSVNEGFEEPEVDHNAGWDIYPNGTPGFDWTVEWADDEGPDQPMIALRESHAGVSNWDSAEGDQHAELDSDWDGPDGSQNGEPANVVLSQNIPTVPGYQYQLTYEYSARPGHDDNQMAVRVSGTDSNVDTSHNEDGTGESNTNWKQGSINFTATGYSSTIEFEETGTPDSFGMLLDNVQVSAVECGSGNPLEGESCSAVFGERDLEGESFFNFNDIKPGDYGRNIISLHVYDNDAWACLISHNNNDQENEIFEPESELGDTSDPEGELSQYLEVLAWQDNNNNGVIDNGEQSAGTTTVDQLGTLGIYDSSSDNLTATSTAFVGVAWCAGDISENDGEISCDGSGMLNDAQSDSFSSSLTAYAEQVRNNPDFSCSEVNLEEEENGEGDEQQDT